MNNYYHEVQFSLNWWMLFAVVSFIVMAVIGWHQYDLVRAKGKYRIKKVLKEEFLMTIALLDAVVFGIMLVTESWRGILQLLDNQAASSDSGVWSLFLLPLAILVAIAVYVAIVYYIGVTAGLAKYTKVEERRRLLNRHRRMRRSNPRV